MNKKFQVLLTHPENEVGLVFRSEALKALESFAEVVRNPYSRRMTSAEICSLGQDVDAVITEWYSRIDNTFLESAKKLKIVAPCAEGTHSIDMEAATQLGIIVASIPEKYMEPLVSLIECYLLCLATGIMEQQRTLREKGEIIRRPWIELKGKTLGLIGMGRLGQRVALMAMSRGMKVIGSDPYIESPRIPIEKVSLNQIMSDSRFIVICCSWTPETTGLIGEREIGRMKQDAFIINPGRGAIIDEAALALALHEGRIAGVAVDVFSEEHEGDGRLADPPIVRSNPLLKAPNVIVTPHIGGHTIEAYLAESMGAVQAVQAVFSGKLPEHVANPEVLESLLRASPRWEIDALKPSRQDLNRTR